jgi:hypothetical protein
VSGPGERAPLVLPAGTVIHMIAFAEHDEACEFVRCMARRANRHRDGVARETIVATGEDFAWAARTQSDLMLVSAHGPANERAEPALGDGKGNNRVTLRSLGWAVPFTFGARAGIIWDACHTGLPAFASQLARLSGPGVAHVAPTGKIYWDDSVRMAGTIIDELLAPGRPPVTPAAFTAAAARAAAATRVKLWHGTPDAKGSS